MEKNWTVEAVELLFTETVGPNFAATEEGQKHLNRIAKAITNESLDKRMAKQRRTLAEAAFNKELGKLAAKSPEKVNEFMGGKAGWIDSYIERKYGNEQE